MPTSNTQPAAPRRGSRRRLTATGTAAAALLACLLTAQPLPAATFPDLYTVTVEADVSANDPNAAATRAAMAQLLTRVTGRRAAASDPDLAHLIERAGDYVGSYGALDEQRIQVRFIASEVEADLRAANWPIWGAERPLTLVWLAVDRGGGERAVLSAAGLQPEWSLEMIALMQEIEEELETVAEERGLPLALPLMDLQDMGAITFAEIWGGFDEQIVAASQRYRPDAVLVGRVEVTDFGQRAQWMLVRDGERQIAPGNSVRDGLDWVASRYAADYGVVGGARSARIEVLGISSLADYGRVLSHLETLSVLRSVDVEGLDGDVLNLRVSTDGDQDVLQRVLTLGNVLVPASEAGGLGDPVAISPLDNTLRFRLARSGG